jgi:hypothetical protein
MFSAEKSDNTVAVRVIDAVGALQKVGQGMAFVQRGASLAYVARENSHGDRALTGDDVGVVAAIEVAQYFAARAVKSRMTFALGEGIQFVHGVGYELTENDLIENCADIDVGRMTLTFATEFPMGNSRGMLEVMCGIIAAGFCVFPRNSKSGHLAGFVTDAVLLSAVHPCYEEYFGWGIPRQSELFGKCRAPAALVECGNLACPVCGSAVALDLHNRVGIWSQKKLEGGSGD